METIKVFEAFAGYGSQSMALDLLKEDIGLDYEVVGISEIDPIAIKAYYAARDPRLDATGEELETVIRGGVRAIRRTYAQIPKLWRYIQNQLGGHPRFQSLHIQFPLYGHQQCRITKRSCRGVWHKVIPFMGVRKSHRNETPQISLNGKREGPCKRQVYAGFSEMGALLAKPRLFKHLSSAELERLWCAAEPGARVYGKHTGRGYLLFPQAIPVRPPP